jgi:hypothetical protein
MEIDKIQTSASSPTTKGNLYAAFRMLSGFSSIVTTVMLALAGFTYNEILRDWNEMRQSVAEIRKAVDSAPTADELDRIRQKVDNLNERLIVIESRCCGEYPLRNTTRSREPISP